ncbi:MAG: hypothetical protein FJ034_08465 [Chloroflexi bacterium]|nr:hypothetical protein [Chloroflexota bacterium]
MGCFAALFRVVGTLVWRALLAAALALVLTRLDDWFDRRGGRANEAWRLYRRSRGKKKPA